MGDCLKILAAPIMKSKPAGRELKLDEETIVLIFFLLSFQSLTGAGHTLRGKNATKRNKIYSQRGWGNYYT
jgi:hypothetical protein